ncbi:uncharacterized protein VTP21DRAFT_6662 [Calcarisporiella thermophila]|uniref:uncharacterized protein n=1 Tax=Calcarisporiella thermophila TaxID=911321 RepID=UPI0037425AC7
MSSSVSLPSSAIEMNPSANATTELKDQPRPKPCCACPETKKARDECMLFNSEESCRDLIEAHKECMRSFGFKV